MKKLFALVLCLCVVLSLTAPALAADDDSYILPDWLFLPSDYLLGEYSPYPNEYGVDPDLYWVEDASLGFYFNLPAYQQAIVDAKAAQEAVASPPSENADTNDGKGSADDGNSGVDSQVSGSDKYPVGSYVDDAGNVWSPDGQLLSQGTTPAQPADNGDSSSDTLSGAPDSSVADPSAADPPVYVLNDMRAGDGGGVSALAGLKALIVSIFGEYTPVTTTAAITETVGSDTTTTLIDVVADGAAGVDYEWCAGVLLFAIMLFCLMKIIGGVMK